VDEYDPSVEDEVEEEEDEYGTLVIPK